MPTDREILKAAQVGHVGSAGLTDPIAAVAKAHSIWVRVFSKASDDAMASTTTSETYTGTLVPFNAKLKAVYYVATTGGITANATNYATITISKRDSAGANKATVASFATDTVTTDDVAQGAPKAFTVTAANQIITENSTFTFEVAKAASGVVVRAGEFWAELEAV